MLAGVSTLLFIVRPHSNDLHCLAFIEHLIDQTMLNIYASRICTCKIADQLLKRWWILVGIVPQEAQQPIGL